MMNRSTIRSSFNVETCLDRSKTEKHQLPMRGISSFQVVFTARKTTYPIKMIKIIISKLIIISFLSHALAEEGIEHLPLCVNDVVETFHHCYGTLATPNGLYFGAFVNGKPNGRGTYKGRNGTTIIGSFKDGMLHGNVSLYIDGKLRFLDEMKNNKRDGFGKKYFENGSLKEEGIWKDDFLLKN